MGGSLPFCGGSSDYCPHCGEHRYANMYSFMCGPPHPTTESSRVKREPNRPWGCRKSDNKYSKSLDDHFRLRDTQPRKSFSKWLADYGF